MATTLEDADFLDLEGEFIVMPEGIFYESVFWARDTQYRKDSYFARGVLFRISDGEIDFNYVLTDDYFYREQHEMTWLDDNQYKHSYLQAMIELVFDGEEY